MGGLVGRVAVVLAGLALVLGCASSPRAPVRATGEGAWHVVAAGETVWRISKRYGVSVDVVRRVNHIDDVRELGIGQRLWIPGARDRGTSHLPPSVSRGPVGGAGGACGPGKAVSLGWPIQGKLTSKFGPRRGRRHDGIDLAARKGTPIRAAGSGRVIYSGSNLGAYGKVVVLKHRHDWATVYAHNRRNLVREGAFVEAGDVIAEVGDTGNATAPHLHFEVRQGNSPRDPLSCLP